MTGLSSDAGLLTGGALGGKLPACRHDRRRREAPMKTRHVVALSMLAGLALCVATTGRLHAEDNYVRKVPLDALTVPVPVPIIPQGSSLDLRPSRAPDAGDQINGYTPPSREATPSIGLSIKTFDDRK
jgi:hypothetical protein